MIRYIPHYLAILILLIATPIMVDSIAPMPHADAHEPSPVTTEVYTKAASEPTQETQDAYPLTDAARETIARIVAGEARGEEITGMCAVADVVFNRLNDGRWGDTVSEICTPSQFHGANYDGEISTEVYNAVDIVFRDGNTGWSGGAQYFCTGNPDAIKAGLSETAQIGSHRFFTDNSKEVKK